MAGSLRDLARTRGMTPTGRELAEERESSRIAAGYVYGNGNQPSVRGYMHDGAGRDVSPTQMGQYYQAAEDMHDPGKGFWEGFASSSMKVFETLAIPHQIGLQLLSGGDWRKAIPSHFAKEQWAKDGIQHEVILAKDVLNIWSDGDLDEYYQKNDVLSMAGEASIKTASFVADIFLDPLTYVPVAGAVKVLRKTLPLGVQAEFLGKIALKTLKPTHAREGLTVGKKFLDAAEAAVKANPTDKTRRVLAAARKNHATQFDNHAAVTRFEKSAKAGEVEVPKATMPKDGNMKPLGPPWSAQEQQAAAKAYLKDHKELRNTVRSMGDDVDAHNMIAHGQDDAGQISDGLAQLIIGTHPSNVKIRAPKVSDFYNSMNLPPDGIMASSIEGHFKPAIASLIKTVSKSIDEADKVLKTVATPPEGTVFAKLSKADKQKYSQWNVATRKKNQNAEWLDDLVGDVANVKKELRRDPRIPKGLIDDQGAESMLPASYRRSPLEAKDYIESQWGRAATKMVGVTLFPKAVLAAPPAWFNSLVREPSRVYAEQSPEMRARMMDGLTQYNFGLNTVRKQLDGIFQAGGIYKTGSAKQKLKGTFITNPRGTVDKEKSAQLFHLLDAEYAGLTPTPESIAKAKIKFDKLAAEASPEMLQAHKEMRALFEAMGETLDLPPDRLIKGYVPRIKDMASDFMDEAWTRNGANPPDLTPSNGKSFWGQLMARRGNSTADNVETDMVKIMDNYSRGFGRKMYIEPMNQDLIHMARLTGIADPKKQWLVSYTDQLVKNVNGAPSAINTLAAQIIGTENARLVKRSAGMFATLGYSAALTGNFRYPVMSILQSLNTTSAKFGPLRTMRGVAKMMTAKGREEVRKSGVDKEITQIYQGISSWAGRLKIPGGKSIQETEFYIRGLTYHAAMGDELAARGFKHIDDVVDAAERSSIIAFAVRETEEANHIFGAIGRPVGFSRISGTGATVATQFFSFPFKQTETLINIGLDNPGHFMDYLYMAGKIQTAAADGLNIDVSDYIGLGFVKDLPKIISGERETIPITAMDNMHKLMFALPAAVVNGDPIALRETSEAFFSSLEMLIPGTIAGDQIYRGIRELKEIHETGSVNVRKARRSNLDAGIRALRGQGSFGELKFGELSYKKTQTGFASIFTGMNTIEAKIEREVQQVGFKRKQQVRALQVSLTDELWDITRTGNDDPRRVRQLVSQLRGVGVDYKDLTAINNRQTKIGYAANMSVKAREGLLNDTLEADFIKKTRKSIESRIR